MDDGHVNRLCAHEIARSIGTQSWTGWVAATRVQVGSASDWQQRSFPYLKVRSDDPVVPVYVREGTYTSALAATNTYDADDIIAFAELFGLPHSPLWESLIRREHFQDRVRGKSFLRLVDAQSIAERANDEVLTEVRRGLALTDALVTERAYAADVTSEGGLLAPALETEIALSVEAQDRGVIDVVSLSEAAQALRLMQVALAYTELMPEDELGYGAAESVAADLERRLLDKGDPYFLCSFDPIFRGAEIVSLGTARKDPAFEAHLASLADPDPAWCYLASLRDALRRNARSVRAFLKAASEAARSQTIAPSYQVT